MKRATPYPLSTWLPGTAASPLDGSIYFEANHKNRFTKTVWYYNCEAPLFLCAGLSHLHVQTLNRGNRQSIWFYIREEVGLVHCLVPSSTGLIQGQSFFFCLFCWTNCFQLILKYIYGTTLCIYFLRKGAVLHVTRMYCSVLRVCV